VGFKVKHDE
jgi:hypothetical protein